MAPQSLFRYEALSPQTLRNLKGQLLYFGPPAHFNDPYDCALTPNVVEPSETEVAKIRDHFLTKDDVPDTIREQFNTCSLDSMRATVLRSARHVLQTEAAAFLTKRGVVCFSEVNDNLLMWAHYSDAYKGIWLEFSTRCEALEKARKVAYVASPPSVAAGAMLLDQDQSTIETLFCTKSTPWSHERAWRVIHAQAGTEYCYRPEDLIAVYFGPHVERRDLEIVCLLLQGQNPTVQFWRGRRSDSEFKVIFESSRYASYENAKELGLLDDTHSSAQDPNQ